MPHPRQAQIKTKKCVRSRVLACLSGIGELRHHRNKGATNLNANLTLPTPGSANSLGANKNISIYTFSATAQSLTFAEDNTQPITLTSNYAGVNSLTYSIVNAPAHGSLTLVSGTTYNYTPTANYNGSDSFTFKSNDGGDSLPATVNLTITAVNDAPIAVTDSVTTNEDTVITFNPTSNDIDVDGNVLTISSVTAVTSKGTACVSGSNLIIYTPNLNSNGPDSITYTISDGNGGIATGSVNVTITPVNDAPVANNDSVSTNQIH